MLTTRLKNAILACEAALDKGQDFASTCQMMGNVLQGIGLFEEAVFWQTWALQPTPNFVEIYVHLGELYVRQKEWDAAIRTYQKALSLNPEAAKAHRGLANVFSQLGNRETEVNHRYQAVTNQPQWATPQNQLLLGNSLLEVDKPEAAIDCYQRAIQLRPDFFEAYYNLGVVYAQQEQEQQAIEQFQKALALNPQHFPSIYGLGKIAEQQGKLQEAATLYEKAHQIEPNVFNACYSLSEVLVKLHQWDKAAAACRQAIRLQPSFCWSHHNLGYVLLQQGQVAEAIESLRSALTLNPDSQWTHYHLGDALLQQQQWQAAVAHFLSALEFQPDLTAALLKLGYALRKSQLHSTTPNDRQAISLQLQHQTPGFYQQLGKALAQYKQYDGAILFYQLALDAQPTDPDLRSQLDQLIARKQQVETEIVNHRQAIREHPDYPRLYANLANLLADQGDVTEAIGLIRQASVLQGWQAAASRQYHFKYDWFTHTIPTWATHLKSYAHYPSVQALEIGSFEGMSACWLLDHILTHPTAHLTCIDLYFQETFDHNLAQTGVAAKVTKRMGDSHTILPTLSAATYDIIYIDGCHLASFVQQDAALSWPLLKHSGLMIFDDYEWTDPNYPGQDCKLGINAFLTSIAGQFEILHQGYQVIIRKLV
ncbi:MAG TPA: tetratricopeptide repeat protein [Trichocoleus sp.]